MKRQLMILLMLVLLPLAALADKKGKCGENVTWQLVEATGVLTIEGGGPMKDYEYKKPAPWNKYAEGIKSVVVKNGVIAIGKHAFSGCPNLTSVSLPNSVTSIGYAAFYHCKKLASINISDNCTYIGDLAFEDTGFTHFEIPKGLKEIPDQFMANCWSLKSIVIPGSVTKIGDRAFAGSTIRNVEIEEGVSIIGNDAFRDCWDLQYVILPDGVKSVGGCAFENCKRLTSIYIPNCSVGFGMFKGCTNLKTIFSSYYYMKDRFLNQGPKGSGIEFDKVSFVHTKKAPLLAQMTQQPAEVKKSEPVAQQQKKDEPKPQPVVAQKPTTVVAQKPTTVATPKPVAKPQPAPQSKPIVPNVDENIPTTGQTDRNTFAVIIGNERYKNEVGVPFAENDAKMVKEYVQKTLGVPQEQIRLIENGGYNDLRIAVNWLTQAMKVCRGKGKAIFYYAGHGIPNEEDHSAYLLPVDGIGNDPASAYSLRELYDRLGNMEAQSVTVFLDACFSGSKREKGMLASARGVAIKAKPQQAKGKMVVFTAAQGDETAYPYRSQQHGMFTYFLLKKLQDTRGNVTLGELGDYLSEEVGRQSFVTNNKMQTPTVTASPTLQTSWRKMKLL